LKVIRFYDSILPELARFSESANIKVKETSKLTAQQILFCSMKGWIR